MKVFFHNNHGFSHGAATLFHLSQAGGFGGGFLDGFGGGFLGGVRSRLANDGEWQGEGGVALATGCNVSQAETQSVTHMVQLCKVQTQVQTQINLPGFFFKISLPSIFRFIKQN